MKVLDYTIRESTPQTPGNAVNSAPNQQHEPVVEYAGKAEQDAIKARLDAYRNDMEALRAELETFRGDLYGIAGKKTTTRKKEAATDE